MRKNNASGEFTDQSEAYLKRILGDQSRVYPCIPAVTSYRKEVMTRHSHVSEGEQLADEILSDFLKFHDALPDMPQHLATDIAFVAERPGYTAEDYQHDFWQLLSDLRARDPEPWPSGFTTDINDPRFQYCLFGKPYFPAGFWQGHPHVSRNTESPIGMMVVFSSPDNVQPYKDEVDNAGGHGSFHKLVERIRQRDASYSRGSIAVAQFFGQDGAQAEFSQIWEYQGMGPTDNLPVIPLDLHLTNSS